MEEKKPRERRSWAIRLEDGAGNGVRVVARKRGDGSGQTLVVHTTKDAKGKKLSQRGATEPHRDLEAAKARAEALAQTLVGTGWRRKEARTGLAAKPDSFTSANLPKPVTTKRSAA